MFHHSVSLESVEHLCRIVRDSARIMRDFARIFNKSKYLGVRLLPLRPHPLHRCNGTLNICSYV